MQAVRLFGPRDLRLCEVPIPQPGPGEIVVQVLAAGICGTDRHLFLGEFPCRAPVTLGHEFSGRVTAVGAVVEMPLGTLVCCDPNTACQSCEPCLQGRVNLCLNNSATGIHRDGGFAEYCAFPAHKAVILPDHMNPIRAALAEPLACTIHAMDMLALRPGMRAIVLGGGVIGLMALQLARLAGAEVMMLTRSPAKQALALSLGAAQVAASPEAAKTLWPRGADGVIECAGVPATVEMAPGLCAAGGRVMVLGVMPAGQKVQIEPFDLLFREIQLMHSFINPFTQARAVHMIASGTVQIAPLISRLLPLSEVPMAIAAPALPADIRVLAVPQ
jgi:L-iditol 2-dehydrogenase